LFQTKAGLCQSLWTIAFASSRRHADEPYAAQAAAAGLQTVRSVRWCRRKGRDVALIAKLPLYFAIQHLQDGMGGGYDCHSGSDGDHELLRLVGQQNARSQVEVSANNSEQMRGVDRRSDLGRVGVRVLPTRHRRAVGEGGTAFELQPDIVIVVDVTHATDQPGVELGQMTKHALGSAPVVARGTTLHPAVTDLLLDTAEQLGAPFTVESLGRGTGTDADAIHASRAGIPTGLISVPIHYMHSSVELASVPDIEAAATLITAFAQKLTSELTLVR
jgi:hypothetical protein